MKKQIAIIMAFVAFFAFPISCALGYQEGNEHPGYIIAFNAVATEYNSIFLNNTQYVPMQISFEKMGSSVFYRNSDGSIMVLSCNGDTIIHLLGDNKVKVNGEEKVFQNGSLLLNDTAYVPIEMVATLFWTDEISCKDGILNIEKDFVENDYQKYVEAVLLESKNENFNPEKFQRYVNCHINMPSYAIEDIILRVNVGLDFPFYENISAIINPNELLVLVNKYNQLPSGFCQYNLVNMSKEYTVNDGKQYLLEGGAYEKYVQMSVAAKNAGLSIRVVSSYRTEAYQRNLYNRKVTTSGKVYADKYSARPGHSEHQTGLAVDINSTNGTFGDSPEFRWLQQHSHEYGFILRYPKGKEWITGYAYEPWHYRYVGVDAAKVIYEENLTYEEYCAKYIFASEYK